MSEKSMIIIGAGGFGREVRSMLSQMWNFKGFVDDDRGKEGVICNIDDISKIEESSVFSVAIGGSELRQSIVERISTLSGISNEFANTFPNIIHPSAILQDAERISLGFGNIITAGSILTCDIEIGNFCVINLSCTMGHNVRLEDFCSLMPAVNLSGNVTLKRGVFIGTGATILQGITIGENAIIGAGAVVTKNVSAGTIVVGVPARAMYSRDQSSKNP